MNAKTWLDRIQDNYDAEHDLAPGPRVTWADMTLAQAILQLQAEVDALRQELNELHQALDNGTTA